MTSVIDLELYYSIESQVFLIVALFNNIRSAMPNEFSYAIQYAAEARVSIKRIEVCIENVEFYLYCYIYITFKC